MPDFMSMSEFATHRGIKPLSEVQSLPGEIVEALRKRRLPLQNSPDLGFLVDTSLGSKAFVVLSGKPVRNADEDVTFVFLSGTPGQFFDLLQIGQQLEENFNVVYIDVLRGWAVTDDASPLKESVTANDLMRLLGESLVRLRGVFGKNVILAPYSSGNITTLPLMMQNRALLPEVRGIVAINPVLAAFMPKPMVYNFDELLLVNPLIGAIARRVAVSSPRLVAQTTEEMISPNTDPFFLEQYVRSWGADRNAYVVPTFTLNGEVVTTKVQGGYDLDEFQGIMHVENKTMQNLAAYQKAVARFFPHFADLDVAIIASNEDHTVRSGHDKLQSTPNARGFMVYNPESGLNDAYEGALQHLLKVNARAQMHVFSGGGHGFWNAKDYFTPQSPFLSVFAEMADKISRSR